MLPRGKTNVSTSCIFDALRPVEAKFRGSADVLMAVRDNCSMAFYNLLGSFSHSRSFTWDSALSSSILERYFAPDAIYSNKYQLQMDLVDGAWELLALAESNDPQSTVPGYSGLRRLKSVSSHCQGHQRKDHKLCTSSFLRPCRQKYPSIQAIVYLCKLLDFP